MTVVIYANDETLTETTSDVWVDKVSASGTIGAGHYIIWASAEYTGSATNKVSEIRVLLDDVEVAFGQQVPDIANQVENFAPMGLVEYIAGGTHTIKLQFRSGTTPNTTRCRRARLLVMKH